MTRKTRRSLAICLLILFVGTVCLVCSLWALAASRDRSVEELLLGTVAKTEYAPGYSNRGFFSIKYRMTGDEVLQVLGEPLDRRDTFVAHIKTDETGRKTYSEQPAVCWEYSRSPVGSSYLKRAICMDAKTGKVIHVTASFHWD
jgi:hypothetical protein